jgi:hypothetical protein
LQATALIGFRERLIMRSNPLIGLGADDAFTVTASGKRFCYAKFQPMDIVFDDIATHLGHTCRWLGALRCHYSTAEHSVLMAQYALICRQSQLPLALRWDDPDVDADARKEFAKTLLLHDAEEYVTGDFPSPLKQFFNPLFEDYASYVREIIYEKYNAYYPWYEYVKDWDRKMLFTEAHNHLIGGISAIREKGTVCQTLPVTIHGWSPTDAAQRFKDMYLRLV